MQVKSTPTLFHVRSLVLLPLFGVVLFLAGCGGNAETPPPTATEPPPTSTPTAIPSPTPSPTPDPVDRVFETILQVGSDAVLIRGPLGRAARDEGIEANFRAVFARCEDVPTWGRRFLDPNLDLWPRAYGDLDSAVAVICQLVKGRVEDYGEPADGSIEWLAVAIVAYRHLDEAMDALPDYSPAQIRRAIADRAP